VNVENARNSVEAEGKARDGEMGVESDLVAEREEERAIARGLDRHLVYDSG